MADEIIAHSITKGLDLKTDGSAYDSDTIEQFLEDSTIKIPSPDQATAEAGTDHTKAMTPLRTKQAIAALGFLMEDIADQATAEAGEDNTKVMTSLRVAQAIIALLATQEEAEAGSSYEKLMTPIRTVQTIGAQLATQEEAEAGNLNTKLMTPLRVAQVIAAILGEPIRFDANLYLSADPAFIGPYLDDETTLQIGASTKRFKTVGLHNNGEVLVPTPEASDNSIRAANTEWVRQWVRAWIATQNFLKTAVLPGGINLYSGEELTSGTAHHISKAGIVVVFSDTANCHVYLPNPATYPGEILTFCKKANANHAATLSGNVDGVSNWQHSLPPENHEYRTWRSNGTTWRTISSRYA